MASHISLNEMCFAHTLGSSTSIYIFTWIAFVTPFPPIAFHSWYSWKNKGEGQVRNFLGINISTDWETLPFVYLERCLLLLSVLSPLALPLGQDFLVAPCCLQDLVREPKKLGQSQNDTGRAIKHWSIYHIWWTREGLEGLQLSAGSAPALHAEIKLQVRSLATGIAPCLKPKRPATNQCWQHWAK